MRGIARVLAVGVLVAAQVLDGAGPAAAETVRWTAFQRSATVHFTDESVDAIADTPRPFTREWGRSVHKEPRGEPEWPARIRVTTSRDPATLTTYPAATPTISSGSATYTWDTTTNGMQPFVTSAATTDLTPGFSLSRAIDGGREVPGGTSVRRTVTIRSVVSAAFESMQFGVTLGPQPGQPITPSAVSCVEPPSIYGSQYDWYLYRPAAGSELVIRCEVTLTNTTVLPARWSPHIFVNAHVSFVESAPVTGTAIGSSDDLGTTLFTVDVPGGDAQGTLRTLVQRLMSLRGENRATVQPVMWNAQTTYGEFVDLADDVAPDAVRPMSRSWGRSLHKWDGSPAWPVQITVDTPLPASSLSAWPAVVPVPFGALSRYGWSLETGSFVNLSERSPYAASAGFDVARSLEGGRDIPGGATQRRRFTVELTATRAVPFLNLFVYFAGPGPAGPVAASDITCSPGPTYPGDPLRPQWAITGPVPAGTGLHVTCDLTLTNTSTAPATYIPGVSASQGTSASVTLPLGATTAAHSDPVLGDTTFTVEPPAGISHQGRVVSFATTQVYLRAENRGPLAVGWRAAVTSSLSARSSEDSYPDEALGFARSWFVDLAKPPAWPASITLTTPADTTGWTLYPPPVPSVVPGGTSYRWGSDPSAPHLFAGVNTPMTVVTTLGASVTRELVGGAVVPPGTATRELVIRIVRSSSDPVRVSTYFHSSFDGPGGPVTASSVSCAGGTPQGTTGAFWLRLTPPIGVPLDLRCSAVLTNTTPYDVSYMPLVIVARDAPPVVSGPHAGRTTYDVPVEHLGTVRAEVTPPAGVLAEGTLTTHASRVLTLGYRNARLIPTRLELAGDASRYVDERVTVSARLTDAVTGAGLAGRWVDLRIGSLTRRAMTDASGVASAELVAGALAVGVHSVTATFAGAGEHLASSSSSEVEVLRIPTSIAYTGDASATFGFAGISARLTDRRSGAPIAGVPLAFTIDGFAAGPATTDATGTAVLTAVPLPRLQPGGHVIGVAFAGDASRAPAQTTAQVAITGSSGRVIGAVVTANGARVELSVASDGTVLSGQLRVATAAVSLHVRDIRALGIAATVAVVYARSDDGHDVIALVTDAGEPATVDRLILRLDGESLTGDGTIAQGNLQILH
ncbi:MAG TPA: hypothetical protein VFM93_07970 [Candidatus Limnocylindria bacterium]|nr:hypothetical protein [Candidatus Limnocylindria bacterium]